MCALAHTLAHYASLTTGVLRVNRTKPLIFDREDVCNHGLRNDFVVVVVVVVVAVCHEDTCIKNAVNGLKSHGRFEEDIRKLQKMQII